MNVKDWKTSKTLWFNGALAFLLILELFLESYPPLGIKIPDEIVKYLLLIATMGNGILRFITKQGITNPLIPETKITEDT